MPKISLKKDHIILVTIVAVVAAAIFFSVTSPIAGQVRSGQPINGLLLGTDWVDYARHSDTLIFVNYNPKTRFLNLISIPRDTRFSPEGYHFTRVNEVYAFNYRAKKDDHFACRQTALAIEELFGHKAPIPYYLQINYAGFRKFIDLIGGVEIEIEEPMHYDDNAQKLHIHFEPGRQRLNGERALEFVRFRGKSGDIGRVYRQQKFIKAVLSRFRNPLLLIRIPQLTNVMLKEVKTNLSFWDMLVCITELRDLHVNDIRLAQLPGAPRKDLMWEVDYENCAGLFDKILCSSAAENAAAAGPKVRIEVWNASSKQKLAEKVTWMLRSQGFDVVNYGTYAARQKKTLIKDLTGDLRSAQRVSELIACGEVVTRYDAKRYVDISVTLGEDCSVDK